MSKETIQLRGKARTLNIEGYKSMSVGELQDAIKRAEKSKAGKGEQMTIPTNSKRKSALAVSGKGKPVASAKSARKSAVKSAPAAKSAKTGEAKRPAAGTAKSKVKSGRKLATGVGKTKPVAVTKTARSTPKAETPKRKRGEGGTRNLIDGSQIDWQAEWTGGQTGNRKIIMQALRRFKGSRPKVFAHLKDRAQEMYGKRQDGRKRGKADAEALLRWHISRVLFDFVTQTGQHKIAEDNANVVRARKNGKGKAAPKATSGRKSAAKPKGGRKSTPKPVGRQKAAQSANKAPKRRGRPPGSKNKPKTAATRTTSKSPARKSIAARRGK